MDTLSFSLETMEVFCSVGSKKSASRNRLEPFFRSLRPFFSGHKKFEASDPDLVGNLEQGTKNFRTWKNLQRLLRNILRQLPTRVLSDDLMKILESSFPESGVHVSEELRGEVELCDGWGVRQQTKQKQESAAEFVFGLKNDSGIEGSLMQGWQATEAFLLASTMTSRVFNLLFLIPIQFHLGSRKQISAFNYGKNRYFY